MKIFDAPLLWQQFNGPQARALIEGGRSWWKSWSLKMMDYFDNWSLATATGKHLDFIGWIIGARRPVILTPFYELEVFRFWPSPTRNPESTGFDSVPKARGGMLDFIDSEDRPADMYRDSSDEEYRYFLQTIVNSRGEFGSYIFLDDICSAYAGQNYTLSSAYGMVDAREEDILVTLTIPNIRAYVSIGQVIKTYIDPFPRIFISMAIPADTTTAEKQ